MGKKKVQISTIHYFESEGANVKIFTTNGMFKERISLLEYENTFAKEFVRVHRSFVVNKSKISQYNSKFVYIEEHAIPVSRSYKHNIKNL